MKKNLLDIAFKLVQGITVFVLSIASLGAKAGKPLRACARAIFPLFLLTYGFFLKLRIIYDAQKKTAGHLLITPTGFYVTRASALLLIGGIVILVGFFHPIEDEDIIAPNSILAHYILPEEEMSELLGEYAGEEIALSQQDQGSDASAIRSPTEIQQTQEQTQPPPFPGELALNPDALLKPIIPTGETLPGPEKNFTVQTYVVQQGDTISAIATRFGLKAATVLWANNLSEYSIIREGQKLTIPPVNGVVYTVRRGDTLARIAQLFHTDLEKIIRLNRLARADSISIGQTLVLPDASPFAPVPSRENRTLLSRIRNIFVPQKRSAQAALSGLTRFRWPTSARRITQYFGWRHGGVDIAGPTSNYIYAAADGRVTLSGWQRGYGLTILIEHANGYVTRYAHARKLLISSGKYVNKGDVIAMVGSTGRSTGPHLHFELHRYGRKLNPLSFIR